jgi:hypothetical protein
MTAAGEQLTAAIRAALIECDDTGHNLPELLSMALTEVAMEQGSFRLIEHRPGSWEATHIEALDMSPLYRPVPG